MTEHLYKFLAKLFYAAYAFCSSRRHALEKSRVERKYVGKNVRVTCGEKHYGRVLQGTWFVRGYDVDAGDLKVVVPGTGTDLNMDNSNWVLPECVEVVS